MILCDVVLVGKLCKVWVKVLQTVCDVVMFLAVIFHLLCSVTPDFMCLCVKCILLGLLHNLLCVSITSH